MRASRTGTVSGLGMGMSMAKTGASGRSGVQTGGRSVARARAGGSKAKVVAASGLSSDMINAIKESYLVRGRGEGLSTGGSGERAAREKKKKKRQRQRVGRFSAPSKESMEWGDEDDTSEAVDELYANPHTFVPGFGRGRFGGIDLEVKSEGAKFYDELMSKRVAEHPELVKPKDVVEVWARRSGTAVVGGKHWGEKELSEMTARDWNIVREDFDIKVKGAKVPPPLRSWADVGRYSNFPPSLTAGIYDAGYREPTPIQMQAIPVGLEARDIIGLAETGSGKTAAFLLPLLARLSYLPRVSPTTADSGPYAVVLAPTRELAQQIEDEAVKFAAEVEPPLHSCVIVGGTDKTRQLSALRDGQDIVIGTPGRINELIESRYLVLTRAFYIILDEADRMIDMGFAPQVGSILEAMKGEVSGENGKALQRQTVMFSATMAPEVFHLAKEYMVDEVVVEIGKVGRAVDRIKQFVSFVKPTKKPAALQRVLSRARNGLVIVFVNEKSTVATVAEALSKAGHAVAVIHGGKSQADRESALRAFRSGSRNVIVATDVLGRGIDVPNVTHVVNYDMPRQMEVYTHRIGRTARAGKGGEAHTFLTDADSGVFYYLKKFLRETNQSIPHALANHEAAMVKPGTVLDLS
ncbi:DEAD-box ATP-dependent RNA helicase 21 [Thecamonas trahens ATCC 50062]|uniref:RNA helicase n=1 Tax=Thecamonas trahens ATCC 50062 TaxID=461836 RepID=A0A0L0D5M1_THETB|nr:DEAD-box ATP-dependent RNA helicase 21 [Thecamonas trahens ATCC 50062]KNC47667.1 DEAD-box ATP-dependent RNA helicase 21 [Thecamonas trahens ATCC 50062]|eukprot:XP_013759151.1 DEAD-box ATP-dependent RNA helicase 21 [Thecamonas trahens ATCC 50062]